MILFKADPLEGQISLFSCILVAKERKKQKKRVKEKETNHVIITLTCMYSIKCFEKARIFFVYILPILRF